MKYQERIKEEVKKLSQNTRQEILDKFKSGFTIGEIRKEYDVELGIVCQIILENVKEHKYLQKVAK